MKKIFAFLFFLCAFKASATSERRISLEELVSESDIIIVADLSEIQSRNEGDESFENGILTVRKNIWGKFQLGERISLHWVNNESSLSGPYYQDTKGKNYIWMLRINKDGTLSAGTRQRMRKLEEEYEIDSLLKANPLYVKSWNKYPVNSPVEISLVYRNVYSHDVKFPRIDYQNGKIYIHPKFKIELKGKDLPTEKVIKSEDSIEVNARTESTITIPIRDIAGFENHGYYLFKLFTEQDPALSPKNGRARMKMIPKIPRTEAEEKLAEEKYLESLKWKEVARTGFYYVDYK